MPKRKTCCQNDLKEPCNNIMELKSETGLVFNTANIRKGRTMTVRAAQHYAWQSPTRSMRASKLFTVADPGWQ
ncbi:hypothetical protein TNCV_418031 [Trichonephila clavipes]|nr:hypothetical protein TNCV_418031 [Trichonephila clavipes]